MSLHRISGIARGVGAAYIVAGIVVAGFAFVWAPWGLLLLVLTAVLWGVAFVVAVIAECLARMEEEDAEGMS